MGPDLKNSRRQKAELIDPFLMEDRTLPHSEEAERGVLGCIMLDPSECIGSCIEAFKDGAEVFYSLNNRTIYHEMLEMYSNRKQVDSVTLFQSLKDKNLLNEIGGAVYIAALSDATPSAANLSHYIGIVRNKYILRKIIATCTEAVAMAYQYQGQVDELVDRVERDIHNVTDLADNNNRNKTARELVIGFNEMVERLTYSDATTTGLPTGFYDLDRLIGGLNVGEMIVIAARPGIGKSSIAMNMADHIAGKLKIPVGIFSLEMTSESLMNRTICSRANVNAQRIRDKTLSFEDNEKLLEASAILINAPIHIDDSSGLTILQLRAKARRMHQQHGIKLVIIDYLQLMHGSSNRQRQEEVSEISNGCKALAKDLSVPVIVLSQLNRDVEKRGPGSKPRLAELRESGSLEQDADIVGLMYRPNDLEGPNGSVEVKLEIAKNRNGPTNEVKLVFFKHWTKFESASRWGNVEENFPRHEVDHRAVQ